MTKAPMRALIADDQPDVAEALRLLLKREGYETEAAHSPRAVLENLSAHQFDVLLMDLNYTRDTTSGAEGLELLGRVRRLDDALPVVVMTAWGNVQLAVEAMRRGARDFVEKPWDNSRLLSAVRQQRREDSAVRFTVREELQDAMMTQHALLPKRIPTLTGCEIAIAWEPVGTVSGDYLDVIRLREDRLGISVGDVAGKGMAAALLMSNLQAAVRVLAADIEPPGLLASRVNRMMLPNLPVNRFITFFYGVLENRRFRFTNAGHHAPMLVRANGDRQRLDVGGPVVGIFPNCAYEEAEVMIAPGDRLVLFTDGIVEAENRDGVDFGEGRLADLITANQRLSAAGLCATIMATLREFSGDALTDDATLLICAFE